MTGVIMVPENPVQQASMDAMKRGAVGVIEFFRVAGVDIVTSSTDTLEVLYCW